MERSEKSERSAFFYPEGRTYSPPKRSLGGGIAYGERRSCRGLVKFAVLICRTAELQPFHDCVALMLSMQNESRSFTRLSEKNLLRIFFSAMDGQ